MASSPRPGTFYFGHGTTMRLVSLSGLVTTLAGAPDAGGLADGVGATARFSVGSQLVLSPAGKKLDSHQSGTTEAAVRRTLSRLEVGHVEIARNVIDLLTEEIARTDR